MDYCFKYIFCSYLSHFLLLLPLCICYTFCNCPAVLGYSILVLFLFSLFYICFSVLEVSINISPSSKILSSAVLSIIMHSFVCYSVFEIQHPFLSLSQNFHFSTYTICSCMFTFSIRTLNILIIAGLNSQSDNPNILAISESGFDACFVSSNHVGILFFVCLFFAPSMLCNFFVKTLTWYTSVKGIPVNKTLMM